VEPELLLGEVSLSMPEGDIINGCCRCGCRVSRRRNQGCRPGIRGKIRVTSTNRWSTVSEGELIRSPRPKGVGEDSQTLFAKVTTLKTSSCVFRPRLGRVPSAASVVCANHGIDSERNGGME